MSTILYNPLILPATFSTASFNLNDSLITTSFSSSQHSAMKVAVSDTNPNSLLPQALHIVSAQIKANSFVLTSSARVCMRISRLMVLRILSSATVSAHDARQSRRRVLACSLLLEDNWTLAHIGI